MLLAFFRATGLRQRLVGCFEKPGSQDIYRRGTLFVLLVVHLLLGFRRLRDLDSYRGDPMVGRLVELERLPDVATWSRALAGGERTDIAKVRGELRDFTKAQINRTGLRTVCLDFDGTRQVTQRRAEGTAVGHRGHRHGRSYFPLVCSIGQLEMFFDLHHRHGRVTDGHGALEFMRDCLEDVTRSCPKVAVQEVRVDSAFFDYRIFRMVREHGATYTCSVPFLRLPGLKAEVEQRPEQHWRRINEEWSVYESDWRPAEWRKRDAATGTTDASSARFLVYRQRRKVMERGPIQLDLFEPIEREFAYRVIVTNRAGCPANVLRLHNGRGDQERLFGTAKRDAALDVVLGQRQTANQLFTLASMMASNISRALQLTQVTPPRPTLPGRSPRWPFRTLRTLQNHVFRAPGLLTRPQGRPHLAVSCSEPARQTLVELYRHWSEAA